MTDLLKDFHIVGTDFCVVGTDVQTSGGSAVVRREMVDKIISHPKIIEAYTRHTTQVNEAAPWTIYVAEPDGSVTVLGDDGITCSDLEPPYWLKTLPTAEYPDQIAWHEKALAELKVERDTYEGNQWLCVDGYSWYDDEYGDNGTYNPTDDAIEEAEAILAYLKRGLAS